MTPAKVRLRRGDGGLFAPKTARVCPTADGFAAKCYHCAADAIEGVSRKSVITAHRAHWAREHGEVDSE